MQLLIKYLLFISLAIMIECIRYMKIINNSIRNTEQFISIFAKIFKLIFFIAGKILPPPEAYKKTSKSRRRERGNGRERKHIRKNNN